MKPNTFKTVVVLSICFLLSGNAWAVKVYQCVNTDDEVTFSNQPCGEDSTLVKELDIKENTNVIGSGNGAAASPDAEEQGDGEATSGGNAPAAGGSGPAVGGGSASARSGGGGGGGAASAGGAGASSSGGGGTTATTTSPGTPAGNDSTSSTSSSSSVSESTSSPAQTSGSSTPAATDTAATTTSTTASQSESQPATTGSSAQATSVTTPLASAILSTEPTITNVEGTIADISQMQILTINGTGFGEKIPAKPVFYWKSDLAGTEGKTPSSLGQVTSMTGAWAGTKGDNSTNIVAPNSETSVGLDHYTTTNAILGRVVLVGDTEKIYVWRRSYDAFTLDEAAVRRVGYQLISGPEPQPGQVVVGQETNATAIIDRIVGSVMYMTTKGGTINDPWGALFKGHLGGKQQAEKMFVYENDGNNKKTGSPVAELLNNQYEGVYMSFNNKIFRFWGDLAPNINNSYMGYFNTGPFLAIEPQNEPKWFNAQSSGAPQKPHIWTVQEWISKASDLDVANGKMIFIQDGVSVMPGLEWKTRTSESPSLYKWVVNHQVSGGTNPNMWRYMDSWYVDNTWQRVILCTGATWTECMDREIQIPTSWTNTSITVYSSAGILDFSKPIYLYILDVNDKVINNGGAGYLMTN